MIIRIPTTLVQSIRQVQEIQRRILEPFAEIGARLAFPVEVIELPEIGGDDPNPEETRK